MAKLYPTKDPSHGLFLLYDGYVTQVGDEHDDSVIYTRTSMDESDPLGEPTYALQPVKYFHALPKVHDRVFVILKEYTQEGGTSQKKMKRYWMGPIEPQWETLETGSYDSKFGLEPDNPDGRKLNKNINKDKRNKGVYPSKEEVAVHKGNTDITLSTQTINIRAGKFVFGDVTKSKLNTENQGVINIKYGSSKLKEDEQTEIINKIVYSDPEYTIFAEVQEINDRLFGYMTVTKNSDSSEVEETSTTKTPLLFVKSHKRNLLIKRIRDYLRVYKRRYNKWSFNSSESEFIGDKKFFDGYMTTIQEEIPKRWEELTSIVETDKGGSVINVMANRINLFSYDGLKHYNDVLNSDKEIDMDLQRKINKELQSIVYGERLLEFLKLVKMYITTHIHPFHGMPPIQDQSVIKINEFNLDGLLNKNIKTN